MSTLEIKGIKYSHKYSKRPLFNQFSLRLETHQTTIILGRSGSGKTTLLEIIASRRRGASGSFRLDGSREECIQKLFRHVELKACLLDQTCLPFWWMTCLENVLFAMADERATNDQKKSKALDLLGEFSLHHCTDRYPAELSGGMQQQLVLARLFASSKNKLLLLDEPFSKIDWITKQEIYAKFSQLARLNKRTTIVVTHDIDEALTLGDRIIVIAGKPVDVVYDKIHIIERDASLAVRQAQKEEIIYALQTVK